MTRLKLRTQCSLSFRPRRFNHLLQCLFSIALITFSSSFLETNGPIVSQAFVANSPSPLLSRKQRSGTGTSDEPRFNSQMYRNKNPLQDEVFDSQLNSNGTTISSYSFLDNESGRSTQFKVGESIPLSSRPTTAFTPTTERTSKAVDAMNPVELRKRNLGVALAAIVFAIGNYMWQFSHPVTPIQLLSSMQANSAPLTVIGKNQKPTVVDFWAPWCENCKFMAPTLLQVEQEYGDRVNFVMVNGDKRESWPLIDAFGVDAIPHMAIVSASGEVETALIGPVPKSVLKADLDTLIMNSKSETQRPLPYTMLDVFANAPSRKIQFISDP